nr:tyrosine-protein phosphatase non-receptor type 18-like [Lytechinus pictus]
MRKNRYKDILPFDHSRFLLSQIENIEGSDYINANYLKGVSNDHSYLAAQGPLPHTVNDFWRMLWESNSQIIVMACNEFEQGRHKCERYWVDDGEEHSFGDIVVTQITQRRVTKDFMIRTLKATRVSRHIHAKFSGI